MLLNDVLHTKLVAMFVNLQFSPSEKWFVFGQHQLHLLPARFVPCPVENLSLTWPDFLAWPKQGAKRLAAPGRSFERNDSQDP